ncbi:MAG: HIT family protein [Deltaproteobacteria bacterium]|nr:HIT family protein [Deltaproteobacteria bacterium]
MTHLGTNQRGCPFCGDNVENRIIREYETVIAVRDKYPVTQYHTLVLPRRHTPDFFTMTVQERNDAETPILRLKQEILERDDSVIGFNIGVNCGEAAGQTIMHAHLHLIPRRQGDTPNPRGGVRSVIPGKMFY